MLEIYSNAGEIREALGRCKSVMVQVCRLGQVPVAKTEIVLRLDFFEDSKEMYARMRTDDLVLIIG